MASQCSCELKRCSNCSAGPLGTQSSILSQLQETEMCYLMAMPPGNEDDCSQPRAIEDRILGARSKVQLVNRSSVIEDILVSDQFALTDVDKQMWDCAGEGLQKLHRWREAGQALRSYLMKTNSRVSSTEQSCLSHNTDHASLCSTCWSVDGLVNSPFTLAPSCIYSHLNPSAISVSSGSCEKVYSSLANSNQSDVCCHTYSTMENIGVCQDQFTPDESNVLPLFDELQEKLHPFAQTSQDSKYWLAARRRKHRLDELSDNPNLHDFSSSSSEDDLYQSLPHCFERRKSIQPCSFPSDSSLTVLADRASCTLSKKNTSQISVEVFKQTEIAKTNKGLTEATTISSPLSKRLLMKFESQLCLDDLGSMSSSAYSSSDTDEIDEIDTILTAAVKERSTDTGRHQQNCSLIIATNYSHQLENGLYISTSSSDCESLPPLLCNDSELNSIYCTPVAENDATLCSTNVGSKLCASETPSLYGPYDFSSLPLFSLPHLDPEQELESGSMSNYIESWNDLASSDASLEESSWDLRSENIETEADDEFECDCPVCVINRDSIQDAWQSDNYHEMYNATTNDDTGLFSFSINEPNNLNVLSNSDVLESLFQGVIVQMLQVYPDLFTNQTPPPVTAQQFESLKSFQIVQFDLGGDISCAICLCPFEEGEDAKCLPCQHFFHTLCVQSWLNKAGTCPVCRDVVVHGI